MQPIEIIEAFDQFLRDRGLRFDAVVIGGAALSLLGVVSRPTKDIDILVPEIPPEIHVAARAFAAEVRATGEILQDDWLNNGPASLADHLSTGWQERLQDIFAVLVDMICCAPSFLLCVIAASISMIASPLLPPRMNSRMCLRGCKLQDANPDWPEHMRNTIAEVAKRVSHDV